MNGKNCRSCPLKQFKGKWKVELLTCLIDGPLRTSELEHRIPKANPRVLARQLRSMEKDGILQRKIYAEVPQKVEYSLTEYGKALIELIKIIQAFTIEHMDTLKK